MSRSKSFRRTKIGDRTLHPSTQMVSYGYEPSMSEGAVKPPVFLTSTFAFQSAEEGAEFFDVVAGRKPAPQDGGAGGLVYSRFNHPNTEIVEDRLALLDGAESALLTASGMAAIGALFLTLTRPGDAVVHYTPLYGGTETLLTKVMTAWGVKSISFTNGLSETALIDALEKAARDGPQNTIIPCKVLHLEHSANPKEAEIFAAQCTGPGSTFSFVIKDDRRLAFRILNELSLFKLAVSLGGTESLICHPASTTHSGVPLENRRAAGITDGLIRLSVGLEHPEDLIEDLKLAFTKAAQGDRSLMG